MSIIKVVKKKHNYTQVDNTCIQDVNLSWKAKGLLVYLISLPDNWEINIADLKNRSKDGRDGTTSAIQELMKNGYILRHDSKNKLGQFQYDYTVFEHPQRENRNGFSVTANPKRENRNGKSVTSKEYLQYSKQEEITHKEKKQEVIKTDFSNPTLPPDFSNLNVLLDAEKRENTPLVPPPPPKEKKDVTMLSSQTEFENKLIEIFSDDMNKQELKSRLQKFGYSKNGAISRGQAELLFSVYADWHLREKDPDNFVYCLKPSKDKKDFLTALSWLISKEVVRNAFKESGSKDANSQQLQPPQPQDLSLYYKQELEKRNSRNAQKIA